MANLYVLLTFVFIVHLVYFTKKYFTTKSSMHLLLTIVFMLLTTSYAMYALHIVPVLDLVLIQISFNYILKLLAIGFTVGAAYIFIRDRIRKNRAV